MKDFFFLAIAHLRHHQKRTWLTMIGIFIGVAAVVALVSLGQGLQDSIHQQFSTFGVDKIIITGKSAGFGHPGSTAAGHVTKEDLTLVAKSPGIAQAAGRIVKPVSVEFNNAVRITFVASLPDKAEEYALIREVNSLRAEQGRLLKAGDKRKAMVGYDLAHKGIFSRTIEVGSKLLLAGKEYTVVGIADKLGDPGRDNAIYLMEKELRSLLSIPHEYSALLVQTAQGENPVAVADAIKRAMRRNRHQQEGKEDFDVQTSEEILRQLTTILQIVTAVLGGIAAVSLLVGGIGIMNTMYTAVLERTRDIGVMKAIGATNRDILSLVLIESGLLGMVGGMIGVVLGAALSKGVEMIAASMWGPNLLHASVPWYLMLSALLFSFLIGTVSGALPARQAAQLKPSEALRYE